MATRKKTTNNEKQRQFINHRTERKKLWDNRIIDQVLIKFMGSEYQMNH